MPASALKKRSETTKKFAGDGPVSHSPVRFKADGGQGTVDAYQRIMGAASTDDNKREPDGIQSTVDAYQRLRVKDSAT